MRLRTLVLVLCAVVAPVLAACEPTPTAVQAALHRTAIDVGTSTHIRGTATPARSGMTVVLERRFGTTWKAQRSMTTTAGGALYFHLNKPGPGTYAYRVRGGSAVSTTLYLKVHDRVPLVQRPGPYGLVTVPGPQTLGTTTYADPISYAGCAGLSSATFTYAPRSEFRVLDVHVGMAMSSPARSMRVYTVRADGAVVWNSTVHVGSNHHVRIDVTGVEDIEIELKSTPLGCHIPEAKGTFVLGDAYLYR
jgi:hypothetical protein